MAQNTSSAVMAQRKEAKDSLDDFPTPPWATRALCNWIEANIGPLDQKFAWEPACNRGHMSRPLGEHFLRVHSTDVAKYGYPWQADVADFLWPSVEAPFPVQWVITNPPYRLAMPFIRRALLHATEGVAMLVRMQFLEGQERYRSLFSVDRPAVILQFTERVVMHRGTLSEKGSTATAYCWVVWRRQAVANAPTIFEWIPPVRKRLERPGDYA